MSGITNDENLTRLASLSKFLTDNFGSIGLLITGSFFNCFAADGLIGLENFGILDFLEPNLLSSLVTSEFSL